MYVYTYIADTDNVILIFYINDGHLQGQTSGITCMIILGGLLIVVVLGGAYPVFRKNEKA